MTVLNRLNAPDFLADYRRAFRTALIIGAGMIAGLAFYLALVEFVRSRFRPFLGVLSESLPEGSRPVLRYAVFGLAVVCVLILRFVHYRMARKAAEAAEPNAALAVLSRMNAVVLVLAETPALLGLALFFLAGYNRDFYILLFVSLFLFFMYFPRLKSWDDALQKHPSICPR
ncbi:MAG: hypothetical protein JW843_04780 [Candidatus Aminicenantes bacterium]|nr:hypothetical protein [Candidatus Aminicenantes bacterium]